jgi:hypothetical protein
VREPALNEEVEAEDERDHDEGPPRNAREEAPAEATSQPAVGPFDVPDREEGEDDDYDDDQLL